MDAYDPLSYENLAQSVVNAMMARSRSRMPVSSSFEGPGVYALYYGGGFRAYEHMAANGDDTPIYVGKAIPPGARKGLADVKSAGTALFRRLADHTKSIEAAENLELSDFRCRFLVVVPVWISLAERFLISHYRPVWNTVIDGFGNHDPGQGRRNMRRPRWDILHPGRSWAARLEAVETPEDVLAALADFLAE